MDGVFCLPACLPACLPSCLPACLSACLSAYLSVCLSACLAGWLAGTLVTSNLCHMLPHLPSLSHMLIASSHDLPYDLRLRRNGSPMSFLPPSLQPSTLQHTVSSFRAEPPGERSNVWSMMLCVPFLVSLLFLLPHHSTFISVPLCFCAHNTYSLYE